VNPDKLYCAIHELRACVGRFVEHDRKRRVLCVEDLRLPRPMTIRIRDCDLERLADDVETYLATLQGNPGGARFRPASGKRSSNGSAQLEGASEPDLLSLIEERKP
jgi:hypothetical protein